MAFAKEHEQAEPEMEVLAPTQVVDSKTLAVLQRAEVDQQIATAKRYPRQMTKVMGTATALVTADAETADECVYALPRAGKIIEGPSIRFAEALAYAWGNCRIGSTVISEDEEFVVARGTFFDLETNLAISSEVRRRITTRDGKRYNADVIQQTANAACSIARRNATLHAIPKAAWRGIYEQARHVIAGDVKTLDVRRGAMIKGFELMGAKREQIFAKLDVKGLEDITPDHLVTLRGVFNAVKSGEMSAAQAFAPEPTPQDEKLAEKSRNNLDHIKEKYAQGAGDRQKSGGAKKARGTPGKAEADHGGSPSVPAATADESSAAPPQMQEEPASKTGNDAAPPVGAESTGADSAPPNSEEPPEDDGLPLDFD